ncbi:MAG: phosphate regulon sensor histidine kinase PhoR [Gammaproteobacteria bacterium]|nr:phosphate regulon sensor histidine kinase PhoR [Gammaproteobacteria bacterium]
MARRDWLRLALPVLLGAGLGLLAGLPMAEPWLGATVVLALLLIVHSWRLMRMVGWLRTDTPERAPEPGGVWGDAVAMVVRLYRDRRQQRSRLLRLLRELRRSTAAMPDGVVLLNPNAEILWFNRTAGRLLGLRGRRDVGQRVENLVRHPEFADYLRAGTRAGPLPLLIARMERRLSIQIVPYGAGQLLMLVRDVTRQARLEEVRKEFVANASHELRSPLTVICGYLETLVADESLPPDLAEALQQMREQARRMNLIVSDLLELSELESSDAEVQGAEIDVGALISQLVCDADARPGRHAELTTSVESGARLLGDHGHIRSAFRNLVDNALRYTPPDGKIALRWWVDQDGGWFSVADTGTGIAAEHIPRLTERFFRVDAGRSRAAGGSGLGLAIVKHVLQRHGARLRIESAEGRGSVFTCGFPLRRLR